jgi:hypothetical protein
MAKHRPVVDDSDVDSFISRIVTITDFEATPPERRAESAGEMALIHCQRQGMTKDWTDEFVRKVRQRFLWLKPPMASGGG